MNEQTIGLTIRKIRLKAGLTLAALAKESDLTKSTLSKIENGQVSTPISTLMRVAKALDVPLADFFYEEKREPQYILTKQGKGRIVQQDGTKLGYAYEGLALEKKDKIAEPFILTINPGDPPGDFHHEGQEFIYMLSGVMEFTIGADVLKLMEGDSLYFDSAILHKTQNIGNVPARFICVFIQKSGRQRSRKDIS
ncbi:MAG: helix-turn-helix domain-containing protein [Spirochaetia bacterium]|nr:helix-turn-helix domain-containing protein [Spirochaetia bacterium]